MSDNSNPNDSNPFSDYVRSTPPAVQHQQQAPVAKKRQRGLSLRSQLLNKNLTKSVLGITTEETISSSTSVATARNDISRSDREEDPIELNKLDGASNSIQNSNGVIPTEQRLSSEDEMEEPASRFNRTNQQQPSRKRGVFGKVRKLHNRVLGIQDIQPSLNGRRIPLSVGQNFDEPFLEKGSSLDHILLFDERTNKPYCNNVITSSRYTLYSFLPRQIYFQFSKIANCYFMIVAIMQMIPSWSTTGSYTTIIPLSIFMTISILREGLDDFKRHLADKEENNKFVTVLRTKKNTNSSFYANDHISKSVNSVSALKTNADELDSHFTSSTSSSGRSSSSGGNNNGNIAPDYYEDEDEEGDADSFANTKALKRNGIVEVRKQWKNVKVGDIVKLKQDDWVPADMVILASTGKGGEAYVETMALDGETNLKSKHPHIELLSACGKASNLKNAHATLVSEDPNIDLYNFEGRLEVPNSNGTSEKVQYALDSDNIIYRGSILRNTEAALGAVVFTGEETKIRMNAIKNPRTKAPKLQASINKIVMFMVIVVCSLAAFSTMAERIEYDNLRSKAWYLLDQDVGVAATLMGFIIMYNTLIPLSLYVTMEIIKVMQFFLLQWDIDMYHKPSNTPAQAKTATILEELGQVSYIFSDKTGTLTNNEMVFRKFSVTGVSWLHDVDLLMNSNSEDTENDIGNDTTVAQTTITSTGLGEAKYTGRPSMASLDASESIRTIDSTIRGRQSTQLSVHSKATWRSNANPTKVQDIKSSVDLIQYLQTHQNTLFSKRAKFFLLSLALCHSCLPKRVLKKKKQSSANNNEVEEDADAVNDGEGDDDDMDEVDYQAASPDELAIVIAARDMGYVVFDRQKDSLIIKTYPNGFNQSAVEEIYTVLDVIEFSSARKRMSVIVRFPDGRVCMFCKGADNIILERLKNADLAKRKMKELSRETLERKNAEANMILEKKSLDAAAARQSMSSITGFHGHSGLGRASTQLGNGSSSQRMNSIDNYLEGSTDSDANEIAESSRRSLQLQQKKKYGIPDSKNNADSVNNITNVNNSIIESIIPSDKLVINDEYIIEQTLHHIEEFSVEGLRTLMYSYKWLDKQVYENWASEYRAAKTSLTDRNAKIEEVGKKLETDFELLGATAIEDKLQEGVADAIEKLRRANIKLWMLTGDKRETAINIGYSCRLIKDYSTVVILSNDEGYDVLSDKIRAAEFEINAGNVAHSVIVVDGATLSEIESDITLMTPFIELGIKADSVICCRASPSQKANMVLSVRNLNKKKVTLAIGDGANDIAMIQSADIGIGITGKEGLQAARSSDYSIAQFRFLIKMLLVHGRYNYVRTSKFVMCTFYKELLFYLSQAIYQRQDAFTGSSLYESWSLSMFNTLFTSLPVLAIGMFEKDLRASTLVAFPELYSKGQNYESFNLTIFIYWMVVATAQSLLVSFCAVYFYGFSSLEDNTTYALCVLSFTTLIVLINTKCQVLEMKNITKINFAFWITSVGGWLVWCCFLPVLYGSSSQSKIFYVPTAFFHHFGKDFTWWASLLVLIVIGVLFDLFIQSIRREILPTSTDDFQILEKDTEFRRRSELHSFTELQQSWTWPHEAEILDSQVENMSTNRKMMYQTKSFIKKGTTHQRKRKITLPSSTELPPGSPSVVRKVTAKDSTYEIEILPSGKLIKRKLKQNDDSTTTGKIGKLFSSKKDDTIDDTYTEDIEEILKERMKGLEEDEERQKSQN